MKNHFLLVIFLNRRNNHDRTFHGIYVNDHKLSIALEEMRVEYAEKIIEAARKMLQI